MSDLQSFKDFVATQLHGMTKAEAHEKDICIDCKQPWQPKTHTDAGKREYRISGMCEECFDALFDLGKEKVGISKTSGGSTEASQG